MKNLITLRSERQRESEIYPPRTGQRGAMLRNGVSPSRELASGERHTANSASLAKDWRRNEKRLATVIETIASLNT
jgi:hypothetical protein